MNPLSTGPKVRDSLVSYFWSNEALRSRSVSGVVLCGRVDIPTPPARLIADWQTEISLQLELEPGNVEALALAQARRRWPEYRHCVQAVSNWADTVGLPDLLASCDVALMACRGAKYHHDGGQYGGFAFCNLFLSHDLEMELHFPYTGQRIPLARGTVVIFDTGQPHALIRRGSSGFEAADFPPGQDGSQIFLTWELPIENRNVAHALQIAFDIDKSTPLQLDDAQVWRGGTRASVCPDSGQIRQSGQSDF